MTLEERQDILEAEWVECQHRMEKWSDELTDHFNLLINEVIKNTNLMGEHFKVHYIDKKERYSTKKAYKEYFNE